MNRPLAWVALAVALGIAGAHAGYAAGVVPVVALALAGVALSFSPRFSFYLQPLGIILLFMAVGVLLWTARHMGPPGDPLCRASRSFDSARWSIDGRVRSVGLLREPDKSQSFVVEAERVRVAGLEMALPGRVQVRWTNASQPVFTDERVRVTGRLSPSLALVNPGDGSYEDYLRRRGIHTLLNAYGPNALKCLAPGRTWSPGYWASRLRQAEAQRLERALPPTALPFILTVWLGEPYRSSGDSYRAYVDSGTAHILSVSGLHLAIVYASAVMILRPLSGRRRLRALLLLTILWMYALTAGAGVGCVRAALMFSLYLFSELLNREPDVPSTLGLSATAFLFVNPDLLFDAGFQLSFLSVASILLYMEPLGARLERAPRYLRDSLAMTFSSQILTLPAAVYAFHVLPLAAPLANLAVVPLLTAALWMAFLTTLCSLLPMDFAAIFGHALAIPVCLIRFVAEGVAATHPARLSLTSPTPAAVVAYLLAAATLWHALTAGRARRVALAVAAGLALATVVLWRPFSAPAEIVFLDVGLGDSAFIRTSGGSTVLIDGGDCFDADGRERAVVPFLRGNRVTRLDNVVATHSDSDHLAGLIAVVEEFPVGQVLMGPRETSDELEQRFLALCESRMVPVRRLGRGDSVELRGGRLTVLHPTREWPLGEEPNNGSLVLRLEWSGPTALFSGDIEAEAEASLTKGDCAAEILKVPHHGSNTSSTDALLDAVRPRETIVSTGLLHGRLVASSKALERYAHRGIRTWRTDFEGGIRLTPEKDGYRLEGARAARGYPVPAEGPRRE